MSNLGTLRSLLRTLVWGILQRGQGHTGVFRHTGQHRQMLNMVLEAFDVVPDYDLSVMKERQTLFDVTVNVLQGMKEVLEEVMPDIVLVHGDPSTTFVTALACFYLQNNLFYQ